MTLDVLDDTLSKLLFWLPHNAEDQIEGDNETAEHIRGDAAWREVGYGILSLHRLSMDLALDDCDDDDDTDKCEIAFHKRLRKNHYGMSIRTKDAPTIAASGARICLTVIHSLMPSLISLMMLRARRNRNIHSKNNNNNNNNNNTEDIVVAASKARLVLEQAKFLLRMYLLVHYWKQQHSKKNTETNADEAPDFGIMLGGGMYHSDRAQESIGIPWDHARALQRRRNYVGERTGWKTSQSGSSSSGLVPDFASRFLSQLFGTSTTTSSCTRYLFDRNYRNAKTVLAEFLYSARPLLWAWLESRQHASIAMANQDYNHWTNGISKSPGLVLSNSNETTKRRRPPSLLNGWLLCLAMDMLSIRLLEHQHHRRKTGLPNYYTATAAAAAAGGNDPFAEHELKRRKMRLLLYVLRSPVWNNQTLPLLEGASQKILRKLPILGNLMETVLWDWILYYQHPFVAEEG